MTATLFLPCSATLFLLSDNGEIYRFITNKEGTATCKLSLTVRFTDLLPIKKVQQLANYLDYYHLDKGYLLTYSFNKSKNSNLTVKTIQSKTMIEAFV